jgi:hypothetical protein
MKITRQTHPVVFIIHQKQLENVEYFKYDKIKSDERCTRKIKSRIFIAETAFNKNKIFAPTNWTKGLE